MEASFVVQQDCLFLLIDNTTYFINKGNKITEDGHAKVRHLVMSIVEQLMKLEK